MQNNFAKMRKTQKRITIQGVVKPENLKLAPQNTSINKIKDKQERKQHCGME